MRRLDIPTKLAAAAIAAALLAQAGDGAHADPPPAAPAPAVSAAPKGDASRAQRAHEYILELSLDLAAKELAGADENDQLLTLERALLALYEGDCEGASRILEHPGVVELEHAQPLRQLAKQCELTTAGAVVVTDEKIGAWVRFQHDADVALAPFFFDVIGKSREVFERDLGVTMPHPIRVEVVRDQFGLSAMTGLPLGAARTTGTIGIAKWGRVTVVSPRATENGYPVMDTLAHELAHLALTRGSRDRAPLWLQEGVARTEETRWRSPSPFDNVANADSLAAFGIKRQIGPEIDAIGPSIALLPSAEEAQITYAKVQSFMEYYAKHAGDRAMPKLLEGLKDSPGLEVNAVVEKLTGATFSSWSARWKAEILATAKELPEVDRPGAAPPKELKEARQRYRLGELLLDRGHASAAGKELARAHEVLPDEAPVRALYARALVASNEPDRAKPLVEKPEDVHHNEARWWSMRGLLGIPDVNFAITMAIALAPYDPAAACEEKAAPRLPEDPARRALCTAARTKPRGR